MELCAASFCEVEKSSKPSPPSNPGAPYRTQTRSRARATFADARDRSAARGDALPGRSLSPRAHRSGSAGAENFRGLTDATIRNQRVERENRVDIVEGGYQVDAPSRSCARDPRGSQSARPARSHECISRCRSIRCSSYKDEHKGIRLRYNACIMAPSPAQVRAVR